MAVVARQSAPHQQYQQDAEPFQGPAVPGVLVRDRGVRRLHHRQRGAGAQSQLDPADTPLTTFSIGIDTPEITRQKTREAADYPILKVKVGLSTDEPTIEAVRSVTKKPLRVDANEGWKDK